MLQRILDKNNIDYKQEDIEVYFTRDQTTRTLDEDDKNEILAIDYLKRNGFKISWLKALLPPLEGNTENYEFQMYPNTYFYNLMLQKKYVFNGIKRSQDLLEITVQYEHGIIQKIRPSDFFYSYPYKGIYIGKLLSGLSYYEIKIIFDSGK